MAARYKKHFSNTNNRHTRLVNNKWTIIPLWQWLHSNPRLGNASHHDANLKSIETYVGSSSNVHVIQQHPCQYRSSGSSSGELASSGSIKKLTTVIYVRISNLVLGIWWKGIAFYSLLYECMDIKTMASFIFKTLNQQRALLVATTFSNHLLYPW